MKRAWICVWALMCGARWGLAEASPVSDLTVVLDFQGAHTARSVAEMQREAQQIVSDAGIHLDWRSAAEAGRQVFPDLVIVQFRGACIIKPDPNLYDELGPPSPLAFTHMIDGSVQPFGEVACDRVAASVRSAMWGGDYAMADVLLGRALARVLVHELVHMLTKSTEHGREGIERPALSGKQLIAKSLPLDPDDLERLRENLKRH